MGFHAAHSLSRRFLFLLGLSLSVSPILKAQLTVTANQTATQLAQKLTGNGVIVSNATLNCPTNGSGTFSVLTSNLGLDSGIVLTSGSVINNGFNVGVANPPATFASTPHNTPGDVDLNLVSGQTTNDACKLEFDFVPAGDTVKFQYVFGSEEYTTFNCSSFNDVFAFFISGPGITGAPNIALVPGTTVPVAISTINNGVGYSPSPTNPCHTNTLGNGPYTGYYVTNTGTSVVYNGFTQVLTAVSAVQPCQTYHLKLAIADASDWSYDSGVFLKAGSLTSEAISVNPTGGGNLNLPTPYTVRGCLPGKFTFNRPVSRPTPLTIKYLIQGTAINGGDYTFIPDSVVIPANGTSVDRLIYGLPTATPTGPKTVKLLILSPYACTTSGPTIIDSAELTILDSFNVRIITPDTAVCLGESVQIRVDGDNLLSYSWSPAASLNNSNIKEPISTPTGTTTYTLSATLPGAGCPATHDQITIGIRTAPVVNVGPDRTTCEGTPFTFNTTVSPVGQPYTYSWSPSTQLNDTSLASPTFQATAQQNFTQYILTVNPGANGCNGYDTVLVRVLPNDFNLYNIDTAICRGASVAVNADGDLNFTYLWTPSAGVSNPFVLSPVITPDTTQTYTVTARYPTCPDMVHSFKIDVQPNPVVYVGPDRAKCQWDTLHLDPIVSPEWYQGYTYSWSPGTDLDNPNARDVIFDGEQDANLTLTVTTPVGCTGSDDLNITVRQGNFGTLSPGADTGVCPRSVVQLEAGGGVAYQWSPATDLSADNIPNPVSQPHGSIQYTVYIQDQYGCYDTLGLFLTVYPDALVALPDSIDLYPGQSVTMNPGTNASYFSWYPLVGLSAANISNPVAMPEVNTRYYLTGTTEYGCVARDSVEVIVHPESLLNMPNAFTPGSQPNSKFKVDRLGVATLKSFRIFNRWGTKVYESNNIDEGWDGTFNGEPQPMGVYIYQVEAATNTGRSINKQGNVTLIR